MVVRRGLIGRMIGVKWKAMVRWRTLIEQGGLINWKKTPAR